MNGENMRRRGRQVRLPEFQKPAQALRPPSARIEHMIEMRGVSAVDHCISPEELENACLSRSMKQKIATLIGYLNIQTGVPLELRNWSTFDV